MKIEYQDKIDRYILGEMSAEERTDFEKQVAQNAELQELLEFTKNVNTAIKSRKTVVPNHCMGNLQGRPEVKKPGFGFQVLQPLRLYSCLDTF